jgi:hypothetical protein
MIQDVTGAFTLEDGHRAFLNRCALVDEVIDSRPYYSLDVRSRTYLSERWALSNEALRGDGIVIPRYSPDGTETHPQIRYTPPKEDQKYTCPLGSGGVIDVHPNATARVQDANEPLIFAESVKGADALIGAGLLAVGFHGVWGWKVTGGPSPELEQIPLSGRSVGICFDVDVHRRKDLQKALKEFGGLLRFAGAKVSVFVLPTLIGDKAGVDDYLALQASVGRG